jgi:uncharacterized membrane protein (UPF0127 family)
MKRLTLPLFFISVILTFLYLYYEELVVLCFKTKPHEYVVEGTDKILYLEEVKSSFRQGIGMMYRRDLERNHGMIFITSHEKNYFIWMKNTYVSLDILFLDKDSKVQCIYKNAKPLDVENIMGCHKPSKYIVELKAGDVDRLKLTIGDVINPAL